MFNWKSIDEIYLYDGTFDGILTIIFDCYLANQIPIGITSKEDYIPNLFDTTTCIITDFEKSKKIYEGILKNISYNTLYQCYYAFLSNDPKKEIAIVNYILNGFKIGPNINTMLSIDYVFLVHTLRKKVLGESHRLKGLLRFIKISEHLYYASIHPDHNILENLGHHFTRRFSNQNFIIHDKIRNIAFLYNQKEYMIIDSSTLNIPNISKEEKMYQQLWKTYFDTISIKDRKNARLQMQYMPKKYWQDLIETP